MATGTAKVHPKKQDANALASKLGLSALHVAAVILLPIAVALLARSLTHTAPPEQKVAALNRGDERAVAEERISISDGGKNERTDLHSSRADECAERLHPKCTKLCVAAVDEADKEVSSLEHACAHAPTRQCIDTRPHPCSFPPAID